MWKHKEKGFFAYNVTFKDGWAYFRNQGIDNIMEESKFRNAYEYEELK